MTATLEWLPAQQTPPMVFRHVDHARSDTLIFTDGIRIYAGFVQTFPADLELNNVWWCNGYQGFPIKRVTHWMYPPPLPMEES